MKKLGLGVYADGNGGMHIDLRELLRAYGWPDNAFNRQVLIEAARELYPDIEVTVTDAPIDPRR